MLANALDHQGNLSSPVQRSNRATADGLTDDRLLTEAVSVMPSAAFALVRRPDSVLNAYSRRASRFGVWKTPSDLPTPLAREAAAKLKPRARHARLS